MQDNAGHFGAFLQDIDIAKCRTLQDISPEKMKNAGQCRTFLPSKKYSSSFKKSKLGIHMILHLTTFVVSHITFVRTYRYGVRHKKQFRVAS